MIIMGCISLLTLDKRLAKVKPNPRFSIEQNKFNIYWRSIGFILVGIYLLVRSIFG